MSRDQRDQRGGHRIPPKKRVPEPGCHHCEKTSGIGKQPTISNQRAIKEQQ